MKVVDMKFLIRAAWRRLLGRCEICGEPRAKYQMGDWHSRGGYCRKHNKMLNFGAIYGAGERTLPRE